MTAIVLRKILKILGFLFTSLLGVFTLIAAYAGYIPPEKWAFPSVLVLMFVPMAILLLATGVVWFILHKWITGSMVILTLFLCGPAWRANFPLHLNNPKLKGGEKELVLLSYNIYNLKNDRNSGSKTSPTLSYIISSGADVVCLQEAYSFRGPFVNSFPAQVDSLAEIYPYRIDYGDNELMVLSKYPVHSMRNRDGMESHKSSLRLADIVELDFHGLPIMLVNVHLTSYGLDADERKVLGDVKDARRHSGSVLAKLEEGFVQRAQFTTKLKKKIDALQSKNVIICGDFNDVPGSYSYRTLMAGGVKDAYAQTGFGPMVTFNAWHMYFHIDQVLYSGPSLRALSCKRGSLRSSDHFPVLTRFGVETGNSR